MVVVAGADRGAALVHAFLGVPTNGRWAAALLPGGISIVDTPWAAISTAGEEEPATVEGTAHCINSRAHLTAAL